MSEENYFKRVAKAPVSSPYGRVLLLICGISLFIPFPTTVVPEWKVRVVNESGKPIKALRVKQYWQNYSVEFSGNEQESVTNDDGYVTFPRRVVWAGLLHRTLGPVLNILGQGVHFSFGPSAQLVPLPNWGSTVVGATYSPDEPLPTEIMMRSKDSAPNVNHETPKNPLSPTSQ